MLTSIQQYPVDIDSDLVNRKNPNTVDDNNRIDLNIGQTQNNLPTDRSSSGGSSSSGSGVGGEVLIMNKEDRTASFFAQPGMLAGEYPIIINYFIISYMLLMTNLFLLAIIGGAVVGLLFSILVVMFIVYRMRKKDEGSYALDEPKRSPTANSYAKNANNREFYA